MKGKNSRDSSDLIGFDQGLNLILEHIQNKTESSASEEINLLEANGRVLTEKILAKVNSPSLNASLKEGYAVHSSDITDASPKNGIRLKLIGQVYAGVSISQQDLPKGTAIRITTGAAVPDQADAVLTSEFTRLEDGHVICFNDAGPGRNILFKGKDISSGQTMAKAGDRLHPALIGLLASAGINRISVRKIPRAGLLATGDEVREPGETLAQGELFASNIYEAAAWLKALNLDRMDIRIIRDDRELLESSINELLSSVDFFISSGGAWQSERDLTDQVLEEIGWQKIFHGVRFGPGKATGFGLLKDRPFFILSGGPASFEAGLLSLAIPGIMSLANINALPFPLLECTLKHDLVLQNDWTQFIKVEVSRNENGFGASKSNAKSRLVSMARKHGFVIVPEGVEKISQGDTVKVRMTAWQNMGDEI